MLDQSLKGEFVRQVMADVKTSLSVPLQSVKHGPEKRHKGTFPPAVFLADNIGAVTEVRGVIMQDFRQHQPVSAISPSGGSIPGGFEASAEGGR